MGKGWWQAPTCELSLCCNSGTNGKTQPHYWLATNHNIKDKTKSRLTENEKKNWRKGQQGKTMNKWACKKLPTYKTWSKFILKTPKAEIPKRNFSLISNPLVLFGRIFKG
jgi:hypothetical protein